MSYVKARQQYEAKKAVPEDDDVELMCEAHGCPNRWSVQLEGSRGLCSAHAWSGKSLWPQITQEQLHAHADLARRLAEPKPTPRSLTLADKRAILDRLRGIDFTKHGRGGKSWAHALKEREEAGEILLQSQRDMWRSALRSPVGGEE